MFSTRTPRVQTAPGSSGPALDEPRDLPPRALNVTALLAPALLAGLLMFETFDGEGGLVIDARAAGLGAAIVAILLKAPMWLVMVIAAAVAATLRGFS